MGHVLHDQQGLFLLYAGSKEHDYVGVIASSQQSNFSHKVALGFLAHLGQHLDSHWAVAQLSFEDL